MSISVIGLGRVGLMTLFHLAEHKLSPCGVDIDKERIDQLKKKQDPFLEPGFNTLLEKHQKEINFSTSFPDAKYNFISVPTPFNSFTQGMDLNPIFSVLKQISKSSYSKKYVFIRSTLIPGTCKKLSEKFQNLSINCFPEFFREGHFTEDYKNTAFSVLGCRDLEVSRHFSQFQFPKTEFCSPEEAEILKSVSNMFHGLKVSFANEVGRMAKAFHCSPHKVMELFVKDAKLNISKSYLRPGFSFGGPCLKKDMQSLHSSQNPHKEQWILAKCAERSNQIHTGWTASQILDFKPKTISILGCSFTGGQTIDYRDSQVLTLIEILSKQEGIRIYGVEKILKDYPCILLPEESSEKLMESDIFILGGWSPLFKKYSTVLLDYQGVLFDLLIQDMPQHIKNHPHYKNLYS